ncbi:MAG TPA: enoyl-CoA hydratase/isomerase family protein [Pyrinomonadaceae bacterium]|nr:enoyl-CoA hydratase/isomerase family protein [Pyrinomonadaceae bacterium]
MNSVSRGDAQTTHVVTERRGAHVIVRINRPEQRNSLSASTLNELEEAFDRLSRDAQIKSVVFTGTGDAFASGADIRELVALTPEAARAFAERGQSLFARIADARQLTIAAINGFCMGGGLDLALACRVRVASPRAVFAHPGACLGIITGWGGTQRLPRLIGSARALEMFATARRVNADEALEFGLVSRLHEDPLACALEIAARH